MKTKDILAAAADESTEFQKWFAFCLKWEVATDKSGNVIAEDLKDGAGITIAGLTTRDDGIPSRVEQITPSMVVDKYFEKYWRPAGGLPSLLVPIIANYNLNCGRKTATRLLQRALQDYGEEVEIDGIMGDNTRAAAFRVYPAAELARAVIAKGERYYRSIATGGRERFLNGWLNRNEDLERTFAA